ncbi:hypothetical protein DMENIID0001_156040 [Sergentomyia squamirostris]
MDENEFEFDNEVEELVNQEENLEILGDDCILFDENPEEENPNVPQDTGSAEDDADLVHFEVIEIEEGLEDDGAHFTDLPEPGPSMTRPDVKCVYCDKCFAEKQDLSRHITKDHRGFPIKYTRFETAKGLKSHLKRHKGKSRISQKQYRDRGSLSNYLFRYQLRRLPVKQETIDSEEKYLSDVTTFSCQYCPRVCLEEHTLQRHIVYSHTGEHACSICGGMFSGRYSLKQHMNSHTRHTAFFTCHICFQTFMKEPLFLRHLKLIHRITRDVTDKTQDDVTILDNNQTAKAPSQSDVDSTKEPNEMELLMPSNIVKIEIE